MLGEFTRDDDLACPERRGNVAQRVDNPIRRFEQHEACRHACKLFQARTAGALPRLMRETAARIETGERISKAAEEMGNGLIAAGFASVDYIVARRADTLAPFGGDTAPAGVSGRLLVAARMGTTRLIDNMGFVRR